jgi:thiol-disulfide isomerase/thioredoxin
MNTHCHILFALLLATASPSVLGADLLTVGSPAPPLEVERFLKGEPVKELSKGTVYVIEFSGTYCAPCIKSFPHQSELQKKHPNVVFICVFDEKEAEVRPFLDKHGETMGFRVALDRDGTMEKNWREASKYIGVPAVYLVRADGIIAWIGLPDDLDAPLNNVLAGGKIDLRLERMKLYFDQADCIFQQTLQSRSKLREAAAAAQHEFLVKHQWVEVVRICEQAAKDFPEDEFYFLWHKLYALAANPQTTNEALKFAAELSSKMPYSFDKKYADNFNVQIARFLVQDDGADDPLLAEAATILLAKSEEALAKVQDEDERHQRKAFIREISAMVAAKKGEYAKAITLQREALVLLRERKVDKIPAEDRQGLEEYHQKYIKNVEYQLGEYVNAAANKAWHPRDALPGVMRPAKKAKKP